MSDTDWGTSLTGSFRPGQMGQLRFTAVEHIAHNLANASTTVKINALQEYTRRNEWRKAAALARILVQQVPSFRDELETVYGEADTHRLLEMGINSLASPEIGEMYSG